MLMNAELLNFLLGVLKLIALKGADGKITADDLQKYKRLGEVHNQPASVSITQACETGLVYQLDEVSAISELAHKTQNESTYGWS